MENLYGYICRQADQAAVIANLNDRELRAFNGYLARLNLESGFPGMIRGLVICEACDRFMKTQNFMTLETSAEPHCGCKGCKEWREGGHA